MINPGSFVFDVIFLLLIDFDPVSGVACFSQFDSCIFGGFYTNTQNSSQLESVGCIQTILQHVHTFIKQFKVDFLVEKLQIAC